MSDAPRISLEVESQVKQAARELRWLEDVLREVHGEPVFEGEHMTVFADEKGSELPDIAEFHNDLHGTDLSREDVAEVMHHLASGVDYWWAVLDPVVVLHD